MKLPRFSLRTLLLFITVATVLCWAYWIGLPRWQAYREREHFVELVKQLRIGMPANDAMKLVRQMGRDREQSGNLPDGRGIIRAGCFKKDGMYVINLETSDNPRDRRIERVEVFRVNPMPPNDYQYRKSQELFNDFQAGTLAMNPGFQSELIHSDPPKPSR